MTTKANGNDVDVFAVTGTGSLSASPTVNPLPGAVPFAVSWDGAGHLVLTEAGTNSVATFGVDAHGVLHPVDTAATGQAATCWIVRSHDRFYASNAGSADLSGYRVADGGSLTSLGNDRNRPRHGRRHRHPRRPLPLRPGRAGRAGGRVPSAAGGSLTPLGSVTVPGAAGGEGIAAS